MALNTIQWIATPDGWVDPTLLPPLTELLPLVKQAGFDAVHPDIPAGMSTQEYLRLLRENCLVPSSGYLSLRLPEEGARWRTTLETARVAAQRHVEMGLRTIFLAMSQIRTAPRVAQPARGAAFDRRAWTASPNWSGRCRACSSPAAFGRRCISTSAAGSRRSTSCGTCSTTSGDDCSTSGQTSGT